MRRYICTLDNNVTTCWIKHRKRSGVICSTLSSVHFFNGIIVNIHSSYPYMLFLARGFVLLLFFFVIKHGEKTRSK